jgi:hypothetical protein
MTNIAKSIGVGLGAAFDGILLFIGAGLVSAGAWLVYHPAGLVAAGALLIAGVVLHGLGRGR